jgi:DNA-directed RNA polymerase specialized sigma24 family protein
MPLSDPADPRREAFLQAFDALSDHVLKRIVRYATTRADFLECGPHDLINDTVVSFVNGDRKWSPETLERDFISAIKSISSNLYVSQCSRKVREVRYVESTTASPSLDDRIDHVQRVRCLLKYFDDRPDEDAALLIRAMLKHSSAKSAADSLGFSSDHAQAVLRRIRRHTRQQWSTKK